MLLPPYELPQFFGSIDIYPFDQLLKGRFTPGLPPTNFRVEAPKRFGARPSSP